MALNELCRLTASAAVELLKRRAVSPLELIDAAESRIAETEPRLNALPTLCLDRARSHARRLMQESRTDLPPHHLHGLPIAVKDNVDVAGVRCTMGSTIFADRVPAESDVVVQRLEACGALVIGKSNIPEFAAEEIHTTRCSGSRAIPGTRASRRAAHPEVPRPRSRPARYGWAPETTSEEASACRRASVRWWA